LIEYINENKADKEELGALEILAYEKYATKYELREWKAEFKKESNTATERLNK